MGTNNTALDSRTTKEQAKERKALAEIKDEDKKDKKDWGKTAENGARNIKKTLDKL